LIDPDGDAAKQKSKVYWWWEECDAVDMAKCILQCGPKGVKSCSVQNKIYNTVKNGKVVPTFGKQEPSCNCNEPKDGGSCSNTNPPNTGQPSNNPVNPPMTPFNPNQE